MKKSKNFFKKTMAIFLLLTLSIGILPTVALHASTEGTGDVTDILFIGNGFFEYGQVPQEFKSICDEVGKSVNILEKINNGYSLKQHLDDFKSGGFDDLIDDADIVVMIEENYGDELDTENVIGEMQSLFADDTEFYLFLTENKISKRLEELKDVENLEFIPSGYAYINLTLNGYAYKSFFDTKTGNPNGLYGYIMALTAYGMLFDENCVGMPYDFLDGDVISLIPGTTQGEKDKSVDFMQNVVMEAVNSDFNNVFLFKLTDDGSHATLMRYMGFNKDVVIPDNYKGKPVTSIYDYAFAWGNYDIDRVTIPDSINDIPDITFWSCAGIQTILGNKGTTAEAYAKKWGIEFFDISSGPEPEKTPAPPAKTIKGGLQYYGGPVYVPNVMNSSWYYGYLTEPLPGTEDLSAEFVPMIYSTSLATDEIIDKIIANGCKHVLLFNEPELSNNISPEEAAEYWPKLVRLQEAGVRIGSPGIATVGQWWLDRYMKKSAEMGYSVDFICYHWYGDIMTEDRGITYMKEAIEDLHNRYGLPVWLTEFSGYQYYGKEISFEDQVDFFNKAVPVLESMPFLERWGWYGTYTYPGDYQWPTAGCFNENGITPVGEFYRTIKYEYEFPQTTPTPEPTPTPLPTPTPTPTPASTPGKILGTWQFGGVDRPSEQDGSEQGQNGWYYMWSPEINAGGNLDVSLIKECVLSQYGSCFQVGWPNIYGSFGWCPDIFDSPEYSCWENNNWWIQTADGKNTPAVCDDPYATAIIGWKAPYNAEYTFNVDYNVSGANIYNGVVYPGGDGITMSVNASDGRMLYSRASLVEEFAPYSEFTGLPTGEAPSYGGGVEKNLVFTVTTKLNKGDMVYFAADPNTAGDLDNLNFNKISVTAYETAGQIPEQEEPTPLPITEDRTPSEDSPNTSDKNLLFLYVLAMLAVVSVTDLYLVQKRKTEY